jgi:hypothetical protein
VTTTALVTDSTSYLPPGLAEQPGAQRHALQRGPRGRHGERAGRGRRQRHDQRRALPRRRRGRPRGGRRSAVRGRRRPRGRGACARVRPVGRRGDRAAGRSDHRVRRPGAEPRHRRARRRSRTWPTRSPTPLRVPPASSGSTATSPGRRCTRRGRQRGRELPALTTGAPHARACAESPIAAAGGAPRRTVHARRGRAGRVHWRTGSGARTAGSAASTRLPPSSRTPPSSSQGAAGTSLRREASRSPRGLSCRCAS